MNEKLNDIDMDFNRNAVLFIKELFAIDGKELPVFRNDKHILLIYSETLRGLQREVIQMRQIPIPAERLTKIIKEMKNLPRVIKIILDPLTGERQR